MKIILTLRPGYLRGCFLTPQHTHTHTDTSPPSSVTPMYLLPHSLHLFPSPTLKTSFKTSASRRGKPIVMNSLPTHSFPSPSAGHTQCEKTQVIKGVIPPPLPFLMLTSVHSSKGWGGGKFCLCCHLLVSDLNFNSWGLS